MRTFNQNTVTVETTVAVPIDKTWKYWTDPQHIMQWYHASDDWHVPFAENDLQVDGRFKTTMAARDDSYKFDFEGTYTRINEHHSIEFTLSDGRKVYIFFIPEGHQTRIEETFETEDLHSAELQREGWQAILDNFKDHAEKSWKSSVFHFETWINASPQKVYTQMIDKTSYEKWTSVFSPGSTYEGSWEKCARIIFLGQGEDGQAGGMVSKIRDNIPFRYISIEHLGIIKDGQEIFSGEEADELKGATENYLFEPYNRGTLLSVDMDANDRYRDFFAETWPKALEILKDICEGKVKL
jgi:uncharacterized protein YndB with AHSA1/START domain